MVRSLYSGVSGLKSHQTRMDVIGNNIANVNTYGFKSSRVCFSDIYYQYQRTETGGRASFAGNNPSQVGYGTQVASIDKNMSMSNFQNSGRTFDCAIAGDGFFMCAKLDNNKNINKVTYTRMGNFGIDSVGNLVNANNEFILGTVNRPRIEGGRYSENEIIGTEPADTPASLDTLNINALVWDAFKPECKLDYDSIPSTYKTRDLTTYDNSATPPEAHPDISLATIWKDKDPDNDKRDIAYDYHLMNADNLKNGKDDLPADSLNKTSAHPANTVYTDDKELSNAALDGTADVAQTYQVKSDYILYSVNGKYVNCQGVEYDPEVGLYKDKEGNYYKFNCNTTVDKDGKVTKEYTYTLQKPVDGDNDGEQDKGTGKVTAATATDPVTVDNAQYNKLLWTDDTVYTYRENDGLYVGKDARGNEIYANMTDGSLKYKDLDGFTIGSDGVLTASYADELRSLARIEVAVFDNPEGLKEIGGTEFMQTAASGKVGVKKPGDSGAGTVESGKLEMSNVNLADEFSDMVVTQRGYQANARIITTSDSMLEELVNLKR